MFLYIFYNRDMERYRLQQLYLTLDDFKSAVVSAITTHSDMLMSAQNTDVNAFVSSALYGYFYDDKVAYAGEDANSVKTIFMERLGYDIAVKYNYWLRKYQYIKKLLTDEDLNLMQSSKMTSSSNDKTEGASGSLQKVAVTPTGVSQTSATDSITIKQDTTDPAKTKIDTDGFVDKYTGSQQKYASANKVEGTRSGEIFREGSIDELLNVLEKLPSSFANEVTHELGKHFIFDYDGERMGYYD